MRQKLTLFILFCALISLAAYGTVVRATEPDDNVVYVCDCGKGCACVSASKRPGKCACGKKLRKSLVLKLDGADGFVCTCEKDCTCPIDGDDPTKCLCGEPVEKTSLKGLYVCDCGNPRCVCTVSAEPGICKCGKELKKAE